MFSKYLPLIIATVVLFLAVGLVTYHPTSVEAQSRPDNSPVKMSSQATERPLVDFTVFSLDDGKAQVGAQGADSPAVASTLRISQVYTRGGEAGATFQNDFVEIFNAGSSNVDLNGWTLAVNTFEGSTNTTKFATFIQSSAIAPGMHLVLKFGANGTNGQALNADTPFFADTNLGSTSGQIMLLSPGQSVPGGCPTQATAADFLGYGTTMCAEGSAATVPAANKSLTRINGGCTDTDNNLNDFAAADPNPRTLASQVTPCGSQPTPTPNASPTPPFVSGSQFNFSASRYDVNENAGKVTITITRTGDVTSAATIDGATSNGTANAGSDYSGAAGTLSFAPGQTQANVDISIIDDSNSESDETFFVTLSRPTGNASLGGTSSSTIVIHDNDGGAPSASPTPAPAPGATGLRISEIYTRGGEAGAT
ncbi:MAG TPA: Calx-beta domain-containing protein, partial [Pyrinomonadaceae bacterium]|nr:Calx-beta domain-containing protein [Pyrinomonadaceae bacterium]